MALEFRVVGLKKDLHNRHYVVRIKFGGRVGRYEIFTNAKIYFNDFINDEELRLSILDGSDCPFDGEVPYLKVEALDFENRKNEEGLRKSILTFIKEGCSEKT